MNKSTRASAVIKFLSILSCCGVIVFSFSSCRKSESELSVSGDAVEVSDDAVEVADDAVEVSDTTIAAWESIFPNGLVDLDGAAVPLKRLHGKMVGLYFSASWCAPCHKFTPHLIEFRNQHQDNFEVVLVGGDFEEEKQSGYMKEFDMPFPATQWVDGKNAQAVKLKDQHKATAIPRLVILSPEGQVVIDSARDAINSSPEDVTELFTNKQKRDELAAVHTKAANSELDDKIKKYNKALEEHFPPHDKDHETTRVAEYTFDSNANDSLEKYPDFALKNTSYDDGALSLNGIFATKDNGYEASVTIKDLNYTQFSFGQEFLIRKGPGKGSRRSTAVVVGGKYYRWFGVNCDSQGELELFFNSGRFTHDLSNTKVALNEWNRILVSVDLHQGIARVWLNGELLPAVNLPEGFMLSVLPTTAAVRDTSFHFSNYSSGETLDGMVDNVVVFDGSLSEAEMAREAASFGSRWTSD